MTDQAPTATKLKAIRERANIGLREMARRLKMPTSSYGHYEDPNRFKDDYLPADMAARIAEALNDEKLAGDIWALAFPESSAGFFAEDAVHSPDYPTSVDRKYYKKQAETGFEQSACTISRDMSISEIQQTLGLLEDIIAERTEKVSLRTQLRLRAMVNTFAAALGTSKDPEPGTWRLAFDKGHLRVHATLDTGSIAAMIRQLEAAKVALENDESIDGDSN